jgi:hypothetical protein
MKNIYIFFPEGNILNNPSINCIIEDLSKENNLKIFCAKNRYNKKLSNISYFFQSKIILGISNLIYNKICNYHLAFLFFFISRFFIFFRKIDLIIGVDRVGLVEGYFLAKVKKKPLIFISFEIFFEKETSKKFKYLEKRASELVKMIIVQDKIRLKHLQIENNLKNKDSFILPLSSFKKTVKNNHKNNIRLPNRTYLPTKKNYTLVLIGSCVKWSMIDEVISTLNNWPENWKLLVHDRDYKSENIRILKNKYKHIQKNKIIFSKLKINNIDSMFKLLQNASLGLALYSPTYESMYTGRNLKYIGLSSGKISIYLKYNIPIISNILKNYPENKRYKLGYEILNVDQIPKILKDFDPLFFREDPEKYFNKYLAYDNYRQKLLYSISNYIDK